MIYRIIFKCEWSEQQKDNSPLFNFIEYEARLRFGLVYRLLVRFSKKISHISWFLIQKQFSDN